MRKIRLTKEIVEALKPLATLAPQKIQKLAEELTDQLPIRLLVEEDLERLVGASTALGMLSAEEKSRLPELLTGLHYLKSSAGQYSTDEFIETILEAYFGPEGGGNEDPAVLAENVRCVLSVKPLRASAKALELLSERDKVFLNTRILSNIRPVFDEDLTAPFLACVVTHSLKVTVKSATAGSETIFLSLDTQDLRDLRAAIDRALLKAGSIASKLNDESNNSFGKLISVEEEDE